MDLVQQVLFILVFAVAVFLFVRKVRQIRSNIFLGRPVEIKDRKALRWKGVFLLALGQKKMFRNWIPAILHFFVYAGFLIINIEILEIILDGVSGTHRMFAPILGSLYGVLIGCFEVLAVLVIAGCAVFLIRRNLLKVRRFQSAEMTSWPRSDANYILIMEIILMLLFLTMNTADQALQHWNVPGYTHTGAFWITGFFASLFGGLDASSVTGVERGCWWLHITGVLFFLNYLPYSKHFHILLAFPNTYFSNLKPKGQFTNLDSVTDVVKPNFDPSYQPLTDPNNPQRFGAKDVFDLSWKQLLDAYTCTECGRCTSACPQNITGKKLSPRKIMMDTRDRMVEVGKNIDKNGTFADDGKSLLGDYITNEEIWACNTCNACVQECPVNIDPLSIITDMRRFLVMEQSTAPNELNGMFSNIENNGAPWQFSPADRANWINETN